MGKKLHVGTLPADITCRDLRHLFEQYGTVRSARVVTESDTGLSRGFGFVEMGSDQEARAAIAALDGQEADGRRLTACKAQPRADADGTRK